MSITSNVMESDSFIMFTTIIGFQFMFCIEMACQTLHINHYSIKVGHPLCYDYYRQYTKLSDH